MKHQSRTSETKINAPCSAAHPIGGLDNLIEAFTVIALQDAVHPTPLFELLGIALEEIPITKEVLRVEGRCFFFEKGGDISVKCTSKNSECLSQISQAFHQPSNLNLPTKIHPEDFFHVCKCAMSVHSFGCFFSFRIIMGVFCVHFQIKTPPVTFGFLEVDVSELSRLEMPIQAAVRNMRYRGLDQVRVLRLGGVGKVG